VQGSLFRPVFASTTSYFIPDDRPWIWQIPKRGKAWGREILRPRRSNRLPTVWTRKPVPPTILIDCTGASHTRWS